MNEFFLFSTLINTVQKSCASWNTDFMITEKYKQALLKIGNII